MLLSQDTQNSVYDSINLFWITQNKMGPKKPRLFPYLPTVLTFPLPRAAEAWCFRSVSPPEFSALDFRERFPSWKHLLYFSGVHSSSTPGVFYKYFYNHAHRLRLEKLLYIELSRNSNGYFKPLLDPGGGFTSETAARRFQK
jgi:hypothetical protein